ncbi:MAG: hypothetical protein LJE90_11820 [Betaproteobacteria bacterium]|jgi:hypothetical protein|nr:hypothetical protein [Betaproteobacteria bacterium]
MTWRGLRQASLATVIVLGAGCASGPPPPDWEITAHGALEAYAQHELEGNRRLAARDFERARAAVARTGRADLLARVELTRCALQVASLEFEPCTGFEALREDAPPAERAYAAFLAGRWAELDAGLLPARYRPIVQSGKAPAAALEALEDPRSRLIAAGVLFRVGRLAPAGIALATETASAQGWRRPLLAWLKVEIARAQAAGDRAQAERLERSVERVLGAPAPNR